MREQVASARNDCADMVEGGQQRKKGLCFVFIASVMFSTGGVLVKMIPWAALSINAWRCGISVCILLIFVKVSHHKLKLTKGVLAGAISMCLAMTCYTLANKLTTAANTILIQFTAPVFIILFLWLAFRERPQKLDIAACTLVLGGIVCFMLDGLSTGKLIGNLVALISGVGYAGMFLMNKFPGGDPLSATILGQAACFWIGLPSALGETQYSGHNILFAILLGAFQLGVSYVFFTVGIQSAPPVSAALVSGIEPILNPIWVALAVGEVLSGLSILGGVIVFVTIMAYNIILNRQETA